MKFLCQMVGVEDTWNEVESHDPESAAEKYAELCDENDHELFRDPMNDEYSIEVKDSYGEITSYRVGFEYSKDFILSSEE